MRLDFAGKPINSGSAPEAQGNLIAPEQSNNAVEKSRQVQETKSSVGSGGSEAAASVSAASFASTSLSMPVAATTFANMPKPAYTSKAIVAIGLSTHEIASKQPEAQRVNKKSEAKPSTPPLLLTYEAVTPDKTLDCGSPSRSLKHAGGSFTPALAKVRDVPPPVTGLRRVRSMPAIAVIGGTLRDGKLTAVGTAKNVSAERVRRRLLNIPSKPKALNYDLDKGAAFGAHVVDAVNDAGACVLVSVAHQLGLFATMAKMNDQPHSAATIAAAANKLRPRYLQELLSSLTCVGIIEETAHRVSPSRPGNVLARQSWLPHAHSSNDDSNSQEPTGIESSSPVGNTRNGNGYSGHVSSTGAAGEADIILKYRLPPEHAVHLTWGDGPDNLALLMQYIPVLARLEDDVADCFRTGAGLDWTCYGQFDLVFELDTAQTIGGVELFETQVLRLAPGLPDALRAGTSILCLGSGVGSTIAFIARAYPKSWFTVYETNGRKAASAAAMHDDIANLHFAVLPAGTSDDDDDDGESATAASLTAIKRPAMQEHRTYAGALVLDASVIRDAASPATLLSRVHAALRPGCALVALEYVTGCGAAAPLLYGLSALQSVPLAVAAGGPALGRGWGADALRAALLEAGFKSVQMHARDRDEVNVVLVATAASAPKTMKRT